MLETSQPRIGVGAALIAIAAVVLGMIAIAAPAQQQFGLTGIWITEALAIALPAFIVLRAVGLRPGPFLGLRKAKPAHLAVAAIAACANQPIVSLLTWAAHELLPRAIVQGFDEKQRAIEAIFAGNREAMLFAVVLAAPLGEELFFRGFAYPALRRIAGAGAAMIVSGALFALIHLDPVGFLGLMEIGILCAALRQWSGSLWPAIVAHAVNNAFAGGAFLLGTQDPEVPPAPWVLVLGGVLLAAGFALLLRILRRADSDDALEVPDGGTDRLHWVRAAPLVAIWAVSFLMGLSYIARQRG